MLWPHDAPIFHQLVFERGYPFGHDWFMPMPRGKTADGRDGESVRRRAHELARGPLGPERPPQPPIDTGLPDDELPHGWVVGEW